jgi:hypothetical protein
MAIINPMYENIDVKCTFIPFVDGIQGKLLLDWYIINKSLKIAWKCISVIEHLPSLHGNLGSIHSMSKQANKKKF